MEPEIEPSVSLRVGGRHLTTRQLEVLSAIHREGSQNRAAARLGISTSVLHRYVSQMEGKVGRPLVVTSPAGSELNELGLRIAMEYEALEARMGRGTSMVVGGTIVTEELLLNALSKMDREGLCELIISDDARNLKDFQAGMMDLMVVDDPLYLYDLEDVIWQEVATDRLLHVDNGPRYGRFMYGAQRIGFRHLELTGSRYEVEGAYRSLSALQRSGLSFFVNESLALRKRLDLRSATDPSLLEHRINAVYREESKFIRDLVVALRNEGRMVSPI
ncbi:MAG TPA: LysR family transcriptional regulator [Methanomassiliicoccaceae archaeon]|jgi:molybdate transport repressor ModE-like protein|nr:LysR family transcriptional regulator [Methanomassiliicoccaceae archaeon]